LFRILFLALLGYLTFKFLSFLWKVKIIKDKTKVKAEKQSFRTKLSKMDVKDAEYKEVDE
jgi:hypothetical protein